MFRELFKVIIFFLQAIIGWFIFVPFSFIIPKQKNLIVFIGRDDGRFVDSVKYLYLYYSKNTEDIEFYFLTKNTGINKTLLKRGLPTLLFPSAKSIFKLLRANVLIVDNWMWILDMKYHMLYNAKKIQIWHGIPLKKIELNDPFQVEQLNNPFYRIKSFLGGKYPKYDLLISTSEYFSKNSFIKSFYTRNILDSGYPRNDQFFIENLDITDTNNFINTDKTVFDFINDLNKGSSTIILYAPTFRDTGGDAICDNILNLEELNLFAEENNIYFIFKFHPDPHFEYNLNNYGNILFYNNSDDVYPLLQITDALITDYSSIYFDYLLLNKPIIYFPYDIKKYTERDRQLDFDFDEFTPGPKCYNQQELLATIKDTVLNNDSYRQARNEITEIAFTNKDGLSSDRIQKYINELFL